jgi:AcrR family transcriptional regulator
VTTPDSPWITGTRTADPAGTDGTPETADAAAPEQAQPAGRRLRADAQRNYDALIEAARASFRDSGGDTSLEEIAKRAGVGIGTLYRHFPTRLALLEAVYRDEVDELERRTQSLLQDTDPREVLRPWMDLFVDYATTKRALFQELVDAVGRDSDLLTHSRGVIERTANDVIDKARAAGAVRDDLEAGDVIRLMGGCTMMPGSTPEQRERMLSVIADGITV